MILEVESADIEKLSVRLRTMGLEPVLHGPGRLAVIRGIDSLVRPELFAELPEVKSVSFVKEKQKLASVHSRPTRTVIDIRGVEIGGNSDPFVIAGPCSIESEAQIFECARIAAVNGAQA